MRTADIVRILQFLHPYLHTYTNNHIKCMESGPVVGRFIHFHPHRNKSFLLDLWQLNVSKQTHLEDSYPSLGLKRGKQQ